METIQEQIGALQAEVKQLRTELDRVLTGKFDSLVCRKLSINTVCFEHNGFRLMRCDQQGSKYS